MFNKNYVVLSLSSIKMVLSQYIAEISNTENIFLCNIFSILSNVVVSRI